MVAVKAGIGVGVTLGSTVPLAMAVAVRSGLATGVEVSAPRVGVGSSLAVAGGLALGSGQRPRRSSGVGGGVWRGSGDTPWPRKSQGRWIR
jgi:hypothetical protein